MSESTEKKLRQTTLSFKVVSKTQTNVVPKTPTVVSPANKKRLGVPTETRESGKKRTKLSFPATTSNKQPSKDVVLHFEDVEAEVSSSSESAPEKMSQTLPTGSLHSFVKLIRCDRNRVEVSSTSASDEALPELELLTEHTEPCGDDVKKVETSEAPDEPSCRETSDTENMKSETTSVNSLEASVGDPKAELVTPTTPVSAKTPTTPVSTKTPTTPISIKTPNSPLCIKTLLSPVSMETLATPVSTETPASPVSTETPASPVSTETPAADVSTETPASPVSTETPAADVSTETPASPVSTETPASPVSTETPAADVSIGSPTTPANTKAPATTPLNTKAKKMSASAKKRKEEREREIAEKKEEKRLKLLQKQEEKLKRDKELEEKKREKAEKREAERRARLKEKEEKQKLKEEIQAKKQAEIEAKKAEKKKKEEEKLQREQERQRLEEENLRKKEAQKNAFLKFFKSPDPKPAEVTDKKLDTCIASRFKPFPVNTDMRLAPIARRHPINKEDFDKALLDQTTLDNGYLVELKKNGPRTCPPTWPWTEDDDDVVAVHETPQRVKFLQFHTDIRPAYFGTWRKKSKCIKPRRPLGQDTDLFDYEVDSADEWEEEEPGESIESGDDDDEEKDEYDFDPELREDGFLVDHNYLSDDEGNVSDEEESLAARKTKQIIARTYGKRNKKKSKLKPVVYGTCWDQDETSDVSHAQFLQQFTAVVFQSLPVSFIHCEKMSPVVSESMGSGVTSAKRSLRHFPEEDMPEFIKAVHGCSKNWTVITKLFQESWKKKASDSEYLSKKLMKSTIQSIASYTKKPGFHKSCWYVNDDVLIKYNLTDLPVPNPLYLNVTSTNENTETGTVKTATPPKGSSPSSRPAQLNQVTPAQKRLTDFVQSNSKRPKVTSDFTSNSPSSVKDQRKIELITVSDSPESTSNRSPAVSFKSTPTTNTTPSTTPRRVSIKTLSTQSKVVDPVKCTSAPSRRVSFTTVSPAATRCDTNNIVNSPPRKTNTPPRRVNFTTLTPADTQPQNNKTSPFTKVSSPSPRRVNFTTLSTPPSLHQESPTPPPPSSDDTKPRRIALTTLVDASQNAPKIQTNDGPIKRSVQ